MRFARLRRSRRTVVPAAAGDGAVCPVRALRLGPCAGTPRRVRGATGAGAAGARAPHLAGADADADASVGCAGPSRVIWCSGVAGMLRSRTDRRVSRRGGIRLLRVDTSRAVGDLIHPGGFLLAGGLTYRRAL